MNATQFDALLSAADDGVEFEALTVETDGDEYVFSTLEADHTGLSESELHEVATEHSPYVTDWYYWTHVVDTTKADRRTFLQWLEDADGHAPPDRYEALADGVTCHWGQLALTTTIAEDGLRYYDVRHVDDTEHDVDNLERHDDPLDARDITTYDEDGRYRPLKTAPSLQSGWVFPDLDAPDLLQTVEYIYPATVPNWYREQEGELDISHWRDTAERQTGIYEIIEELDRDAVEWIAQACCDDSQCTKRREWQYEAGDELAADGGDGEFPCREPCSLVVAAARKWTTLENESEKTFQMELTLSELRQIEEIIDTVAEGRVDEIREADVYKGANRYRARYLRAKRFDEDGELAAVEVEE
jgi:hypothetical protein